MCLSVLFLSAFVINRLRVSDHIDNSYVSGRVHSMNRTISPVFLERGIFMRLYVLFHSATSLSPVFLERGIFMCLYGTLSQCFYCKSTAGYVVTNEMRVSDRQQLRFGSCPFDESNESVESTMLNRQVCCQ